MLVNVKLKIALNIFLIKVNIDNKFKNRQFNCTMGQLN